MNNSFYCILANGKHNSVSASDIYEARRRALNLGAAKLFVFNAGTKTSTELQFK